MAVYRVPETGTVKVRRFLLRVAEVAAYRCTITFINTSSNNAHPIYTTRTDHCGRTEYHLGFVYYK